jgi:large subunit ribosomal protein L17
MRHRVAHRKLGVVTEHRLSMLRSLATDLLRHEHIRTTVPRAKELRPFVERLITTAKRSVADGATPVQGVNARRAVARDIRDPDVVKKLFRELAPRYVSRPGGYLRILRVGYRRGDAAEVAQVELVGSEYNPKAAAEKAAKGAKEQPRSMRSRLRAAAARLRGRKADQPENAAPETGKTE